METEINAEVLEADYKGEIEVEIEDGSSARWFWSEYNNSWLCSGLSITWGTPKYHGQIHKWSTGDYHARVWFRDDEDIINNAWVHAVDYTRVTSSLREALQIASELIFKLQPEESEVIIED